MYRTDKKLNILPDSKLLQKLSRPAPRYTSYPTAPNWKPLNLDAATIKLGELSTAADAVSLYFHIPFCHSMCLYCGCSVILNRREEKEEEYVDYLIREIELATQIIGRKKVHQLHFGGGTPTKLSIPLFSRLFKKIQEAFALDFSKEIAIEIDPRTVSEDEGEKLKFLRKLGFNRVSFGVQDTNPKVQEAVKRRQSYEMTKWTFELAKELGFEGINIDLIYGLPYQTTESFQDTVSKICDLQPDRIALFSYAKVPWLKPHQNAMKESTLPSTEEKFSIYAMARKVFIENGYTAIGMDHFALEKDELAIAYRQKKLHRNFQGYSVGHTDNMLGFGVTSIGFVKGCYLQNLKNLDSYYASLKKGFLPIGQGLILSQEDALRKWVIQSLMCNFELDKNLFYQKFDENFDEYFKELEPKIEQLEVDGLIQNSSTKIQVSPIGELFVRLIASVFDAYLHPLENKFSNSI